MGCEKLYCSCCETAYADGFADGFKSGFRIGYKRGFRSGYISGYLDGYEGYKPLPNYEREIARLIAEYKPLKLLEPIRLSCGCYSVCTCSYQYRIYGR